MNKKAILFDLDGTLLPMDQDTFVNAYFGGLCRKLAPYGYDPKLMVKAIWAATKQMILNTTDMTNEDVFWNSFAELLGEHVRNDMEIFRQFYLNEFKSVRSSCGFNPKAREIIDFCKAKGLRLILATNPIFPKEATYERLTWAGLSTDDFEFITTYENSTSTKPNPRYYTEILNARGLKPEECLMVGNDAEEDGAAVKAGLDLFLITDTMINSKSLDISSIPQGSFDDLAGFLEENL